MTNFWQNERVRLHALEPADIDVLLADALDSAAEQAEDAVTVPQSQARTRAHLETLAERTDADKGCFLGITTLQNELVGTITSFDCDPHAGCFKYALVIRSPFRRQGFGRAAIVLMLRHSFRERRYQKCTVIIYSFNTASIRLHEALGFSLEGRLRRMVFTNGRHYNELYYGLTAEEFAALDPLPELPTAV